MSLTSPERLTSRQRVYYRGAFVVLMLAAIGFNIWQTVRNARQQDQAKSDLSRAQGLFQTKLAEQNGKLDTIAGLWQQFLISAPAQLKSAAAWGAYQTVAKATINIARLGPPGSASPPTDHSVSQYGQLSDDQLIAAAKAIAEQMSSFRGEWKYQVEVEVGARYQNEREKSPTPKSAERIGQLWDEEEKARESVNQQYALKSKDLFARADDLRGVCADRLQKKGGQLPTDGNIADVFKRLATAGIDGPYGRNSDPDRASKYLLDLCKRLGPS